MKNNILNAINDLDDDIIMSVNKPSKKTSVHPFKKIKWTAVAAAIAILAAIPAAAYALGFTMIFNENNNLWESYSNNRFSVVEYSEEIQNLKESVRIPFSESGDIENFIGITFPKNSVLENIDEVFAETNYDTEETKEHWLALVGINEGKLLGTHAIGNYSTEQSTVTVCYSAICEENPYENGGGFGFVAENGAEEESYISPCEREFKILSTFGDGFYREIAFTEIDRLLVTVDVVGSNKEIVRSDLLEIIDAYK